ncbi:MAG: Calx-beta domain-containing protein [Verrucomicrobiota bacterium]|jgi:uncharacterized delta-60 repeat protein/uncharacterized repeat protein (TIGR01451 family)
MFTVKKNDLRQAAGFRAVLRAVAAFGAAAALVCQAQNPPPNDNLANAQGIVGVSGSVSGTNLYATAQTGEPAPYPGDPAQSTIWYAWTAPITTTIDFNTRGSTDPYGFDLDTVLAVYRLKSGTNVAFTNLTVVAQNDDDFSGGVSSRVDFAATLGSFYLIQVDSKTNSGGNAQGYITLNWGPSLLGGTFGFTTSIFPMGQFDDGFIVQPPNDLGPSVHNPQDANNARITITRTGGFNGRCEMLLIVTNSYYTNRYITNFTGTNIYITNYDATGTIVQSYTNVLSTNTAWLQEIENVDYNLNNYITTGLYYIPLSSLYFYSTNYGDSVFILTNGTGVFGESFYFPPIGMFNITNYFTNFLCVAPSPQITSGTSVVVNGTVTNVVVAWTNIFCYFKTNLVITPSAIDGEDYESSDTTDITFDDYQMSKDVYLNLPAINVGFTAGPDYPDSKGNYLQVGVNSLVELILTNVPGQVDAYGNPTLLDPLEDPDILPPTISPLLGVAYMDVLNFLGYPQLQNPFPTNLTYGTYATLNLERATFRVNKSGTPPYIYTNTIWVVREPLGWPQPSQCSYTLDTYPPYIPNATLDWNRWPTVAGSDYANPSISGLPDWDFAQTYTGNYGVLMFPANSIAPEPIYIAVTNNGAQEFDSDIYIQLFLTTSDAGVDANPSGPTVLGNVDLANLTINFNNPIAGVQPAGAVDRTYNVDSAAGSFPPNNPLPGANAPVEAIAIQANGLPVIGGEFTAYNSTPDYYVARLVANGQLDFNFNQALGSGPNGDVKAIVIDSSGRIIIGGDFTSVNGKNAYHIARLNTDGSLDTTFVTGYGFSSGVYALVIDPTTGNIVAGGDFTSFNTTNCSHIARLLPTGGLDPSFLPSSGAPYLGTDQDVNAVAIDYSGNVVLGGEFTILNGTNWNHIGRLLRSGALDTSFNPGVGADGPVYSLAIQPNNAIILGGGFQNYNLFPRASIARLTSSGALDTTFDPGTGANDVIYSVVLQPDGNILIGGQFTTFNTTRRVGVARLLPSGWLDTYFLDTAYNQFAGVINHYYNTYAYNPNDAPSSANTRNIVKAMAVDGTGNVIIGGNFIRIGGGTARDDVHSHKDLARLIGAPSTGPETGGAGNCPGNITMTLNPYTQDDTANKLYVTLDRVNGSLGPATVTLGTNTFTPGPGSATQADFGLATPVSEFHDVWDYWNVTPGFYGWRVSDGYYGFNYSIQPALSDNGSSALWLAIHNDTQALQNLFASLSLLNLNENGLLSLGGQTIPTCPALGQYSANLEIINDNFPAGIFGFSATNYTVVDTGGFVTITVVRTNGDNGPVTVNYTTYNGFTNGAGTNVAVSGTTPQNGDYVKTTGELQFTGGIPGESHSFQVQVFDHSTLQPTKFFNILLTNVTGGGSFDTSNPPLVSSSTVVQIIDGNFLPGHLEFSLPAYSVLKGSPATVTVNRVGGAKGQLTVDCGTGTGTAINGLNYTGVTNLLSWADQSITPQTMTIQTLQDNVVEGAKTVNVSLFNANISGTSGGAGAISNSEVITYPSNVVLTINDIDSYGNLNFVTPNFNILQNAGQALITVVRTNGTVGTVTVAYTTANGTNVPAPYQPALAGTNYGAISNTLTFGPGVTSQSFVVPIFYTPDETNIANRIFTVTLFNGNPSAVAGQFPKTATVTILDNQLVLSPAGSVDQTTLQGTGFNNFVQSLALQPNNSLLVGGNFTFFNSFPFDYAGRLLPDCAYDNSFLQNLAGGSGTVERILSLAPNAGQTNGSIMVVGAFTNFNQVNLNGIARLNLDGSLDETFNPGSGADSTIFALAEQLLPAAQTNLPPVPFYVIAGNFANYDGAHASGVARLTQAGLLDSTFNIGGGVTSSNAAVYAVAIEPNNQILLGGDFTAFNNAAHHHLLRLNVDGSVDTNFAAFDGVSSDINGSVRAIQVQPDSRILIGGLFTSVNGSNYNYLARLNNDGTLDTNFNIGPGCNNSVLALALDSQSRILVGGEFSEASGVSRNGITRLNPDGTVDPTINFGFGANGFIDTIVIETNDEIDLGGGFTSFNNTPEGNFVRVYGGANAGDGSLQFIQQTFGVLESASNAVITIQRLGGEGTAAQPTVSAVFFTSDGTAVNPGNYIGVTNTVIFPLGETFRTINVPIIDNTAVGPDLSVNLDLTNSVYAGIGPRASAMLIITNVNSAVSFSANSYRQSASVPSGYAAIPVVREGNPNNTVYVTVYTGTNGTAVPFTNYVPETNAMVFVPGVLTNYFLVPLINSPTQFGDLTVDLEMTGVTNAVETAPDSAVLTIGTVNNAPGVLAFSQTNYAVSEGATNALIGIIRTNGTYGNVVVTLTTSNLTAVAGVNYAAVATNVTFSDGESAKTVAIPVFQQSIAGPDVTVQLTLSNPQNGATIGGLAQEVLTIENDIANFSFGQASYFTPECNCSVTLEILRSGPTNTAVQVYYTTSSPTNANDTNGFAVPNVDYVPVPPTLIPFAPGETFQTVPINIIQGNSVNGLETFFVNLTNPSPGVQIGVPGTASVGIVSDVTGFAFSTTNYTIGENGSNVLITVNRINPNTGPVSVDFTTADASASNLVDYVATNGTLNFTDTQSVGTFSVQILNPNLVETNKTFNVFLLNPSANSYLVSPSNAVVVITNVYAGVNFQQPGFTVSECGVQAVIPVVLTGVTNNPVSVYFSTANGSGSAGTNYFATNGTLTFQPGQTVETFDVEVINNHVIGPDHTVQLNLSNPIGAKLLNPSTSLLTIRECNGADIIASGTAFETGSIQPGTGVIYPNDRVTIWFGLRDIYGGNATNVVATLLTNANISNVGSSQTYPLLIQNGPTVAEPFTFTALGSNGQNFTASLALRFNSSGSITNSTNVFGFTLGGATTSFTNSQALTIIGGTSPPTRATNAFPPGYGYPSVINASGVVGNVTKVTATLTNFGHTYPSDVDVVLESPGGQDSVLMSHCGSNYSVQNVTITFDQTSSIPVPTATPITNGTYFPTTNFPEMPQLPPVLASGVPSAPVAPYVPNLSTFVGNPPNGVWALWVIDDKTLDSGYVNNGWILNISTGTPVENDSDLELTVTPSTTNATINDPNNLLSYYLTVTNAGPSAATNVIISNFLPAGVSYVTNSCGCQTTTNAPLTFTLPALPVGAGAAFSISVMPTNLGFLTNITTASANEPDPNSNNVVVISNVLVIPPSADVGVTMAAVPNPVLVGGYITYTIVVTNGGPSSATNVLATQVLPTGFQFSSASPSAGTVTNSGSTVTWSIATLTNNSTGVTLTVVVKAMEAETGLSSVTVSSPIYDPYKLNNFASAKIVASQPMLNVSAASQTYSLTWPSSATNYTLEGAVNLPPLGTWIPITSTIPVVAGQYTFGLPGPDGYRFFRLKTQLP